MSDSPMSAVPALVALLQHLDTTARTPRVSLRFELVRISLEADYDNVTRERSRLLLASSEAAFQFRYGNMTEAALIAFCGPFNVQAKRAQTFIAAHARAARDAPVCALLAAALCPNGQTPLSH